MNLAPALRRDGRALCRAAHDRPRRREPSSTPQVSQALARATRRRLMRLRSAGVIHLTKVGATDLAKHNIRMNAICPGFIQTNIFASSMEVSQRRSVEEAKSRSSFEIVQPHPAGEARRPAGSDIANMVAFLASKEAGFITGSTLRRRWRHHHGPAAQLEPRSARPVRRLASLCGCGRKDEHCQLQDKLAAPAEACPRHGLALPMA